MSPFLFVQTKNNSRSTIRAQAGNVCRAALTANDDDKLTLQRALLADKGEEGGEGGAFDLFVAFGEVVGKRSRPVSIYGQGIF
jgi:hypothetical protein